MEEKNKRRILLIALAFMVVLTFTYSYNQLKKVKEDNTPIEKTTTPADSDVPIENYVPRTIEEEPVEKPVEVTEPVKKDIDFDKVGKILKQLGYTDAKKDKRCKNDETCFTNKVYFVHYGKNVWLDIEKEVKASKMKDYDSKGDLLLIGKLIDNESLSKRKNIFNWLFHKFDHSKGMHDFFIQLDGLFISTYYSLNDTLEYSITTNSRKNIKDYDFYYLDTILNDTKGKEANQLRKQLYDYSMKNKKDYFPYYELVDYYFDFGNNEICSFEIEHNHYTFKSSYCHGGTSNTYYDFGYKENYKNQDTILISVKATLFEREYNNILNHNLEFINDKTKNDFKLSKTDLKEIKKVISHAKDSYTFVIDYKLEVTISYNKNSKNYTMKYLLNK